MGFGEPFEAPRLDPNGDIMTIGYGNGSGSYVLPFSFRMPSGQDQAEVNFFKFFFCKEETDLSLMLQDTPIFSRGFRGMGSTHRQPFFDNVSRNVGSITIPVIQRKSQSAQQ